MNTRHSKWRRSVLAWAFGVPLVLSAGCSDQQETSASDGPNAQESERSRELGTRSPLPEPVQQLDIDGNEYTFSISPDPSAPLKSGWTLLNFNNVGIEAHQVMFARIKDGVDLAELAEAGADDSSGAGAIEFVDMIGGVSYIGAGHDTTALVNLESGTVMAMCYVPDPNGKAHALSGMSTALTVEEADGAAPTTASVPGGDEALGTIELSEDGYLFPERLDEGWYRVRNTDSALHELSLMELDRPLDDDETDTLVRELADNQEPSVELEAVGGMGAISPGFDGYLYLDLDPGEYLAVDFMPDPGVPTPHMVDGYYATFTV